MANEKPKSDSLTLLEFMRRTYLIPEYQRDYAWQRAQVEDFLSDLFEFNNSDETHYYFGQVILAPGRGQYDWELVDGQQRVTSFYLLLVAAMRTLEEIGFDPHKVPKNYSELQLALQLEDPNDRDKVLPSIQGSNDARDFMTRIANREALPEKTTNSTEKNILRNFTEIRDKLKSELVSLADADAFISKMLRGVIIVELRLENAEQALEVFEKVNNRGLRLDSADLLKNLLFSFVNHAEYDATSQLWEQASKAVRKAEPPRAANMQFLLKAMISAHDGQSTSSKKLYGAWKKYLDPESHLESEKAHLRIPVDDFRKILKSKALDFATLSQQRVPATGEETFGMAGTRYFGAVQHYLVLLAGSHLDQTSYRMLESLVEDRAVLSLLARERTQDWERIIPPWSHSISQLASDASRQQIVEASRFALQNVPQLFEEAEPIVKNLSYANTSQRKRIRYVLARASKAIENKANSNASSVPLRDFLNSSGVNGYHLDHVFPRSALNGRNWDMSWGLPEVGETLGNLALLHPMDNVELSDALPHLKAPDYASSNLLLSTSLCTIGEDSQLGKKNARIGEVITELHLVAPPQLSNWSGEAIRSRANLYWQILKSDLEQSFQLN